MIFVHHYGPARTWLLLLADFFDGWAVCAYVCLFVRVCDLRFKILGRFVIH
jgi:hypothetical protein